MGGTNYQHLLVVAGCAHTEMIYCVCQWLTVTHHHIHYTACGPAKIGNLVMEKLKKGLAATILLTSNDRHL